MRSDFLSLGDPFGALRLHYTEWGDASAGRTVLCVHGLTRNARDFDELAAALAESARVICVDVAGRGRSDWLSEPTEYRVDIYARHLRRFLDLLGVRQVDWVGTSMGGLIGMVVAAEESSPIERLVLNDIGPFVPKTALDIIKASRARSPLPEPGSAGAASAADPRLLRPAHGRAVGAPRPAQLAGCARRRAADLRSRDPGSLRRGHDYGHGHLGYL